MLKSSIAMASNWSRPLFCTRCPRAANGRIGQTASIKAAGRPPKDHPQNIKDLPDLGYADPVPLTGTKGQIAASTTALIHAGSRNVSDKPSKLLFIAFTATGTNLRFNVDREDKRLQFLEQLREKFRPQRRYIIDSTIEGLKQNTDFGRRD